jgi:hypothetical protein
MSACLANPSHLCGNFQGAIRGYRMEYAPELNAWTVDTNSDPKFLTAEQYLHPSIGTSTNGVPAFELNSTLENYFSRPFGPWLSVPGIRSYANLTKYQFHRGEAVKVDVAIELEARNRPPDEIALPDDESTLQCWGIKQIDPDAIRKSDMMPHPSGSTSTDIRSHLIRVGLPYHREIDLSQMMSFEKLGTYNVQVLFSNNHLPKGRNVDWMGFLSGEAFTVTIEP